MLGIQAYPNLKCPPAGSDVAALGMAYARCNDRERRECTCSHINKHVFASVMALNPNGATAYKEEAQMQSRPAVTAAWPAVTGCMEITAHAQHCHRHCRVGYSGAGLRQHPSSNGGLHACVQIIAGRLLGYNDLFIHILLPQH